MPLQFQPVTVPLGSSQDESHAPFVLPIPLLAQLENARILKTGAIEKRLGWHAEAALTPFERVLSVGEALFTIQQRSTGAAPVVLGTVNASQTRVDYHPGGQGSYSLSEIEVLERATIVRDGLSGDQAGRVPSSGPDFAVSSAGIAVIAWEVGAPKTPLVASPQHVIFAVAIDVNTRQVVDGPRQLSTGIGPNESPRVVLNDATHIVVVYQRPSIGEIRGVVFDCTARTWGADTVIVNNLSVSQPKYDANEVVGGTGWYLIFRNTTPVVQINRVSLVASAAVATLGEDANDPVTVPAGSAVAVYPDAASNNLWCAWYDSTNGLRACVRQVNSPATVVLANTTMEAVTDSARQITWAVGPAGAMILVWTTNGAATLSSIAYGRKITKYRTLTTANVKGVAIQFADVELLSKAYSAPNGLTYAAVLYDASDVDASVVGGLRSVTNQVAFTMAICETAAAASSNSLASFRCAATWAQGEAGRKRRYSSLSAFRPVVVDDGVEYWWVLSPEFDQVYVSPQFIGRPGVDLCRQRITNIPEIFAAPIGGNIVFSGGVPQIWDGAFLNEYGFLVPPENGRISNTGGGSAGLSAGVYSVLYVYEYRHATGDIVQSLPSVARLTAASTTVTTAAGNTISGDMVTLSLTRKWAELTTAEGLIVRAYRTEANGTKYYSEGDVDGTTGFVASYPFGASLSLTINQADSIAVTHSTIYNDGGLLPNFAPPALAYIHTHRNRLFGIVAENRRQVVFTHEYAVGELPGWHPSLIIDVPDEAVALATIDEKLVIFCRHGVYLISGDGPDRKGLNSDYQQPFRLNSPHGCKSAASVVSFPDGIMYLSQTGFCMMNRKTDIARVGGPVEDTVAVYPYAYASLVNPEDELIYWAMVDARHVENVTAGRTIVFDWRHNVWSVDRVALFGTDAFHTSFARTKAGVFSTIEGDPSLYLEFGNADPGGSWIYTRLKTGMLHLGSNQLFQRARWLTLLGQRRGSHALDVTVDTFTNATSAAQTQTFSWTDPELAALPSYALKMHLKNQKGAFFQVTVADAPTGLPAVPAASASFVGLMLEMGLKKPVPQMAQTGTR